MTEVFKPIKDYEGSYEVSNLGRIKKLKTDKRKEYISKHNSINKPNGYYIMTLYDGKLKTYLIHRLVAIAFIPNPDNKPEVNHINGIKSDNRAKNLEWATHIENINHSVKNGLCTGPKNGAWLNKKGKHHPASKPVIQIDKLTGNILNEFDSTIDAFNKTGVNRICITFVCNGKTKTAGGYKWKFK